MRRASLILALLAITPCLAERPPQLRKDAQVVVKGVVEKMFAEKSEFGGDGIRTSYKVKVKVTAVEKGDVKVGDVIEATWFHVTKAPTRPLPGAYGQKHDIKEKDEARFWLMGGEKGPYSVIYNTDGIEKVKK
jgi:hypothetical protein